MLLCGLWHGAAWVFVLWGAFHGVLFAVYDVWSRSAAGRWVSARQGVLAHTLKCLIFFQFVCLGWLLFRSDSVSQAISMLRSIAFNFSVDAGVMNVTVKLAHFRRAAACWSRSARSASVSRRGTAGGRSTRCWRSWRRVVIVALLGAPNRTQFIYFQF